MKGGPPLEGLTMGTLTALAAIRRYIKTHPDVTATQAAIALQEIDADLAGCNFGKAVHLHTVLPHALSFEPMEEGARVAIRFLINRNKPFWVRSFPFGRQRVLPLLDEYEIQCFRAAELFDDPPSLAVVQWWDDIATTVRAELDGELLAQGRDAEVLTLDYEAKRLTSLGLDVTPHWTSIEDNNAGYDIKSYDPGDIEPVARQIEVKSSFQKPPRFHLTRKQWETALKFGDRYFFYIWEMPQNIRHERTVEEVRTHIPQDQAEGEWQEVIIALTDA